MKAIYDVAAPAKLNLFLHITGRRSDGYHLLQSVFMLIDWCDTLHFERRGDGQISREDLTSSPATLQTATRPADPLPANDLCVRAARALQWHLPAGHPGKGLGVHIGLAKSIPTQAGMGGGSSDAASTLLALNRLWNCQLALPALLEIGLKLGADVPFFLQGHNAWVEGIGEHITPIALPAARFVVAKPPEGLETATIFAHPDLPRNSQNVIISGFVARCTSGEDSVFEFGRNDLQVVAQNLSPGIGQGLEWLKSKGLNGRMTGSGSAVFAKLNVKPQSAEESRGLYQGLFQGLGAPISNVPPGFRFKVCNNLPQHPLLDWAGP